MFFKKKKKKTVGSGQTHPIEQARDFINAAEEFENSRIEEAYKSKKVAWRVATAGMLIGIMGVAAVVIILPLKTTEHWLIRVDNNTGAVDVVKSLKNAKVSLPESVDRSNLARYVINRESYDWESIQTLYDNTILLSGNKVQKEYKLFYNRPDAPHRVLKNQQKVVVRNPSVSFIGDLAQVRFEKYVINTTGELASLQGETTKWIATIAYHYDNPPMTDAERLINPLGFQVTSYRVDPENFK